MNLGLNGKRALVTGSTGAIGQVVARRLAAEGVAVVLQGRRKSEGERIRARITDEGGTCSLVLGDLTTDTPEILRASLEAFGGIDILVNNAGAYPEGSIFSFSPLKWNQLFGQNLFSSVGLSNQLIPLMQKMGWGRVVMVSSIAACQPDPRYAAYGATKAAMESLTKSLGSAMTGSGVTCNCIQVGFIATENNSARADTVSYQATSDKQYSGLNNKVAKCYGSPADVADLVSFLVSYRAAFIQGTTIRIDGGQLLYR